VSPEDLSALVSARALIIVVVAGVSLAAPVLVAVLLTFGEDLVSSHTEHWLAVMGVLYVLVAMVAPADGWRLRRRPRATPAEAAPPAGPAEPQPALAGREGA
jgi:branched-chain amino acid transport system permease protein